MKILASTMTALALSANVLGAAIDERADADPTGHVHVSNVTGDVVVSGWTDSVVEVTGTLGDNAERLEFERDGRHTTIKVHYPDGVRNPDPSDLVVRLPRQSELTVSVVSGDVTTSEVDGAQRVSAVSGDVEAEIRDAAIEATTVSGDVTVTGAGAGALTATTVSGSVEVADVSGELTVKTVSGGVGVRGGELSAARLRTTNGEVSVDAALSGSGRLDAETVNGRVRIRLADLDDLELDLQTFNGNIETCADLDVDRPDRYGPGRSVRATLGDGQRRLRVKTLNGRVDVCGG